VPCKVTDEISLVPAELLAQKERKNRVMVPNAGCINAAYKFQKDGNVRPWGGINQVFVGDFYQLPPSYGKTSLASVPCDLFTRMQHLLQNASALYGINLMWNCVTHLVELEEMIRCKDDAWYVDVLTQMRKGALCEDYWAYIHGKDTTTKPGSFVYAKETVLCGNDECVASWTESRTECKVCKAHRKSRALVAYGPEDARYDLPQFQNSKNLMSFNDNRCDVGQRRAQRRARETTQRVAYVICEDKTSDEELKRDPKLADKKAQWAKYHDRMCGNMCGKLPVFIGAKLMLTQHVSHKHGMLRYRQCTVVGWKTDPREPSPPRTGDYRFQYMPLAIIVEVAFQSNEDRWHIKGLDKPGEPES
jgi:hypothetical protein